MKKPNWHPDNFTGSAIIMVPITISPEMVPDILTLNEDNRPVREANVDRFARLFTEGAFHDQSCNTIKFSTKKKFIDGQHRLKGLLKAGATATFNVMYNVPPEQAHTIDRASMRNDADSARISGRSDIDKERFHLINIMSAPYGATASDIVDFPQKIEFFDTYKEGIEFAMEQLPKAGAGKIYVSPQLRTTVAKAFYFAKDNRCMGRLKLFCQQLRLNQCTDPLVAALAGRLAEFVNKGTGQSRAKRASKTKLISWL